MSAAKMAPRALEREMRRVLRRLGEPRAFACETDGGMFGVFVARNAFARAVLSFDAAVARELASEGLTTPPPRLELLPEGRASLVRALAGEDAFPSQHRVMGQRVMSDEAGRTVAQAVNLRESPLAWLASRKGADGQPLITALQFEAGERLRADFTRGQLQARVTVDWSMPFSDGGGGTDRLTVSEAAMAARTRVGKALEAVGAGLSDVLVDVCCHLKGLEDAERALRWPPRTGKVVLRIALDRLGAHYGLIRSPVRSSVIKGWSADSTC